MSGIVPVNNTIISKKFWSKNTSTSNFIITFSDNTISQYDNRFFEFKLAKGDFDLEVYAPSFFYLLHPSIIEFYRTNNNDLHQNAFFAYSGYRKLSDSTIESITNLIPNPFENALDFDKSTDTKTFVHWLANILTKKALASVKKSNVDQNRASEYKKIIDYIENIISEVTDQVIEFDLQEDPLKIIIIVDNTPLEFDQLPDGLKSIISWVGDLIMRLEQIRWVTPIPITDRHFMLFLDEIEIHLHPAWQRKILPVIQKTFKNAQIFISTHSPFIVGSIDGAWVYKFKKTVNGSELEGPPILSEDSYSYEYILNEIFGIKERFGIEVEKQLNEFIEIKNKVLSDLDYDNDRLKTVVESLKNQSIEIQNIIGMEIRQLNRLTNQRFEDL